MKKQEFNIQDYLSTQKDRQLFLMECFRQDAGDGSLITAALKDVVEAAGKAETAALTGIEEKTLTRVLAKGETLPFTTVLAISRAIGVKVTAKKAKIQKVKKNKQVQESAPEAAADVVPQPVPAEPVQEPVAEAAPETPSAEPVKAEKAKASKKDKKSKKGKKAKGKK